MSLLKKIELDLMAAIKRQDPVLTNALRGAKSAITLVAKNQSTPLTEAQEQATLKQELKKLIESREQFQIAHRPETVARLDQEIAILDQYLPQPLRESELNQMIDETINELKPSGRRDLGRVVGAVMQKAQGRADGSLVSRLVSQRLI